MEYQIGDISKLFHLSNEMIRYYEKQGIIPPAQSQQQLPHLQHLGNFFTAGIFTVSAVGHFRQKRGENQTEPLLPKSAGIFGGIPPKAGKGDPL